MCEIQFIKKKDKPLNSEDINAFFKMLYLGSFSNKDATGIFNDKYSIKKGRAFYDFKDKEKKTILNKLLKTESNFIIGHNRYATSGLSSDNKNNHPFESEHFIIVHNGVIHNDTELIKKYNLNYNGDVDTLVIIHLLEHFYNKKKNSLECIKKMANKLEGSFSLMIYNKDEKNIYYLKNHLPDFHFCLIDDTILMGSTEKNHFNSVYSDKLYIFDKPKYKTKLIKKAIDNTIYLINDEVFIKPIGVFEDKKDEIATISSYNNMTIKESNEPYNCYSKYINETEIESYWSRFADYVRYYDNVEIGHLKYRLNKKKDKVIVNISDLETLEKLNNYFLLRKTDINTYAIDIMLFIETIEEVCIENFINYEKERFEKENFI